MPEYTVTIKARYDIPEASSPKKAIEIALSRSDYPDMLTVEAEDA